MFDDQSALVTGTGTGYGGTGGRGLGDRQLVGVRPRRDSHLISGPGAPSRRFGFARGRGTERGPNGTGTGNFDRCLAVGDAERLDVVNFRPLAVTAGCDDSEFLIVGRA